MTMLAWWSFLTIAIVLGFLLWAFAPILIPVLLIVAALAVLVALIVSLARWATPAAHEPSRSQQGGNEAPPRRARRRSDLPD